MTNIDFDITEILSDAQKELLAQAILNEILKQIKGYDFLEKIIDKDFSDFLWDVSSEIDTSAIGKALTNRVLESLKK